MEVYSIYFNQGLVASELTLTNCLIMLEALYKTYKDQDGLALTVVRNIRDNNPVEEVKEEEVV